MADGGAIGFLVALGALRLVRAATSAQLLPRSDMLDVVSTPLGTAVGLTLSAWLLGCC